MPQNASATDVPRQYRWIDRFFMFSVRTFAILFVIVAQATVSGLLSAQTIENDRPLLLSECGQLSAEVMSYAFGVSRPVPIRIATPPARIATVPTRIGTVPTRIAAPPASIATVPADNVPSLDRPTTTFEEFANAQFVSTPSLPEETADENPERIDASGLLSALDKSIATSETEFPVSDDLWWEPIVQGPLESQRQPYQAGVEQLIQLAISNSAQIRVYEITPEIRETAVTQAQSAFDWTNFLDTTWQDTSDPVGSSLTVGGAGNRYSDHNITAIGGFRRRNEVGATTEIFQRIGHQNTNSTFFLPNNQGTTRLVLGYNQPLLRGRGKTYNRSLIVLAGIDVGRSRDEYQRQLQQHLLEVARSYWSLYLERTNLIQKLNLYERTEEVVSRLVERQRLDTGRSQVILAEAALSSRRADLIRTRAASKTCRSRRRKVRGCCSGTPPIAMARTYCSAPRSSWPGTASALRCTCCSRPRPTLSYAASCNCNCARTASFTGTTETTAISMNLCRPSARPNARRCARTGDASRMPASVFAACMRPRCRPRTGARL